jgi:hypothetical protein
MVYWRSYMEAMIAAQQAIMERECAGYMGHPFKKSLFDNDDSAFQTPFLRTGIPSSQHNHTRRFIPFVF